MKKTLLAIFAICISILSYAEERTFSYGPISSYCPKTGQTLCGGSVISVTIGDGYIIHSLYGRLNAVQLNYDGSTTYMPSDFAGTPSLQMNCVLVSSDLQRLEERMTSSIGNMSINIINSYTSAGEDGGRYAQNWANAQAASRRGSTSTREDRHSSSGTCSACGGTGVNKTPNSGGSLHNWVAYYNSSGTKCPYCNRVDQHFHDKCPRCNTPAHF